MVGNGFGEGLGLYLLCEKMINPLSQCQSLDHALHISQSNMKIFFLLIDLKAVIMHFDSGFM